MAKTKKVATKKKVAKLEVVKNPSLTVAQEMDKMLENDRVISTIRKSFDGVYGSGAFRLMASAKLIRDERLGVEPKNPVEYICETIEGIAL